MFDDADAALSRLDGAAALAGYEALDGVRAQAGRVRALWLLRRWDEARQQLSALRGVESVHVALARGVVALGQPDLSAWISFVAGSARRDDGKALAAFTEAMRLDPECAEAVAGYATACRMSGQPVKAQQFLVGADRRLRASTPVLVELALCALTLGDLEAARDHVLAADDGSLRAKLARLEVTSPLEQDADLVIAQAEEILRAHPGAPLALAAYGRTLANRARGEAGADRTAGLRQALVPLQQAVSADHSPTLVFDLARCHVDLREHEQATQLVDEAIEREPDSPALRKARAFLHNGGSPSQRLDAFHHVLDADPRDLTAQLNVVEALIDLNRRDEARAKLSALRDDLPGNKRVIAAWTSLETPWQLPADHDLKTRVRHPWQNGEDDPEHVLDLLTGEVVDDLRLTPAVAERLRHRVLLDRGAVLRRAFREEQTYLRARERAGRNVLSLAQAVMVALPGLAVMFSLGFLAWLLTEPPHVADLTRIAALAVVTSVGVIISRWTTDTSLGKRAGIIVLWLTAPVMLGTSGWLAAGASDAADGVTVGLVTAGATFFVLVLDITLSRSATNWKLQLAFDRWAETLYGRGLLPAAAESTSTGANFGIWLPAHCRIVSDAAVAIDTDASRELARLLAQRSRGSFALAGPRGAGKSTLLERWCAGEFLRETERPQAARRDLALKVDAPVGYDSRDFLVHLFGRLCEAVETYDTQAEPPWRGRARLLGRRRTDSVTDQLARRARRERDRLRYLQSWTTEHEGSVTVPVGGFRGRISLLRQDVPLTHPELVDRFRDFLQTAATVVGKLGGKVLIGIDELDRIHDGDGAQRFLNELKAVFNVPNCYFLVSVSEDALADFELSAMGTRTVFDSAFDTIVRVDYLGFDEAKVLLSRRIIDLPEQFGALAYVLSGGLARELARTVEVIGVHRTAEKRELGSVTADMVARQLNRTARAAMDRLSRSSERRAGAVLIPVLDEHPRDNLSGAELRRFAARVEEAGHSEDEPDLVATVRLDVAVMAEYLAVLLDVFDNRLNEERLRTGRGRGIGGFETLARARRYLGANPYGARELLHAFREAWATGPGGR